MAKLTGMRVGTIDDMLPVKVNLRADCTAFPYGTQAYAQNNCALPLTTDEWATAVQSVAPFLNAQGLKHALAILDGAIANIQRSKAVSESCGSINDNFYGNYGDGAGYMFQKAAASAQLQAYLDEQQQILMQELQNLPFRYGLMNATMPPLLPSINPEVGFTAAPMPMEMPWIYAEQDVSEPTLPTMPDTFTRQVSDISTCETIDKTSTRGVSTRRRAPQTLSSSLRSLENENPECLLIVRRIGKLGFKAARALKKHYSAYGPVMKVLLAHSTARQYCDQQIMVKRRPSNLGFIQMATAEGTNKILAAGTIQEVEGVSVTVQRFERHGDEDCDEFGTEEQEAELPQACSQIGATLQASKSERVRGLSDASTIDSPPLSFTNGIESGSDN